MGGTARLQHRIRRPQQEPIASQQQVTDDGLRHLAHQLGERVKELNCLFGISEIVERSGGSLDTILQETVELLPPSWEFPEIACARIELGGREYQTDNYASSTWKLAGDIFVRGKRAGVIEVCYLEEKPGREEGPFSAEERKLLNAIAERLGHVAERLQTERLLHGQQQELRERLTHLSRVSTMGEMASNIAHEVNQPLTAISTYAQAAKRLMAADQVSGSYVMDVLTRISEEALRAGEIIHRLKDLVRKRGSSRERFDVNRLIHDIEQLAAVDCRLHDVQLRMVLSKSLPPVLVDGVQIQQVVLNLIRNGVDAMEDVDHEPREVVIRTIQRKEGEIEVSVSDRGCGPPDDIGDQLFQPFFTTKDDGLGMGLSISRSIVQSHGGNMWYARNPHGGTTFFFSLPATSEDDNDSQ